MPAADRSRRDRGCQRAERTEEEINSEAEAKRLLRRHPEADVDEEEVAEVLREEIAAGSIM